MGISVLAPLDNVDDRRELIRLLQLLNESERVRFITHVCKALGPVGCALKGENVELTVTNDTSTAIEAYGDILMICTQFGINLKSVAESLEQYVRHVTNPAKRMKVYVPGE